MLINFKVSLPFCPIPCITPSLFPIYNSTHTVDSYYLHFLAIRKQFGQVTNINFSHQKQYLNYVIKRVRINF